LTDDHEVVNITTVMKEAVSAADANRRFSELLRRVRLGESIVVTSHGKAVARIIPMTDQDRQTRGARAALLRRLRAQPVIDIGKWSREDLYQERE
jgi:prevent-host-death family protein